MKQFSRNILSIICLAGATAMAQMAAPDKVAQVKAGTLKEARASWWGFNEEDSHAFLQEAVNSNVPRLIIDKMPKPWIIGRRLVLASNQEIVFEEGVELLAKRGAFKSISECLVEIPHRENIVLRGEGKGATLRMWKADYHTAAYQKAEWRHTLNISGSKNITIANLALRDSGGDGIYFGMGSIPPTDIVVKNVICDGHNRQGISVIAGVNVLLENVTLSNTRGTAPEAGIDFEPNKNHEPIRNFVIRNCHFENNAGNAIDFYLPNIDSAVNPMTLTIENTTVKNEPGCPFKLMTRNGGTKTLEGFITLRNCTFENTGENIYIAGSSHRGMNFTFENITMKNIAQKSPTAPLIAIAGTPYDEEPSGNLHFKNVVIHDNFDRPTFVFSPSGTTGGLENISGAITVIRNGRQAVFTLSDEWAAKTFPKRKIRKIPAFPMDGVAFEPITANPQIPDKDFSSIRQRESGQYIIWAKAGDTVNFSAQYGQLGNYKGTQAAVTCTPPGGKPVQLGTIPFQQIQKFSFQARETGFHALQISAGINWSSIVRSDHPIFIKAFPVEAHLISGRGDCFVYIPSGSKEVELRFCGDGAEGLKATVFSPDGRQIWQKDDISLAEQCIIDGDLAQNGGAFRINIAPPTHLATLEDHYIRINGAPALIGLDPQLLVKPVK